MVSFQLFRFEVIGEQGWRLRSNEMGWNCFQLFRFEVIGEPAFAALALASVAGSVSVSNYSDLK